MGVHHCGFGASSVKSAYAPINDAFRYLERDVQLDPRVYLQFSALFFIFQGFLLFFEFLPGLYMVLDGLIGPGARIGIYHPSSEAFLRVTDILSYILQLRTAEYLGSGDAPYEPQAFRQPVSKRADRCFPGVYFGGNDTRFPFKFSQQNPGIYRIVVNTRQYIITHRDQHPVTSAQLFRPCAQPVIFPDPVLV